MVAGFAAMDTTAPRLRFGDDGDGGRSGIGLIGLELRSVVIEAPSLVGSSG